MNISLISNLFELVAGLGVGMVFGFLLNKAGVTRFQTIAGQLMLKDFTVMKVIMTAITTGSLILFATKEFIVDVPLIISSTTLLAALLGGGIFGIGMATLGYCPGTCVGALSFKSKDVWAGIVGMFVGVILYAEIYPWVQTYLKPAHLISKATLAEYFNVSPWYIIAAAAVMTALLKLFPLLGKGRFVKIP